MGDENAEILGGRGGHGLYILQRGLGERKGE